MNGVGGSMKQSLFVVNTNCIGQDIKNCTRVFIHVFSFNFTPCIRVTPKRVLLQTEKTHMKCCIMLHFIMIRVYIACKGKIRSSDKRIQYVLGIIT